MDDADQAIRNYKSKGFSMERLMKIFVTLRWVLNIFWFGLPWMFFSFIFVGWNFMINILWNKWWAGGNIWLMLNTVFAIN